MGDIVAVRLTPFWRRHKHGGQKGIPRPEPRPETSRAHAPDPGIVRDHRGQGQPRDKARAQQVSRQDSGDDPPGEKP